uniref:Telomere length regulation protein TEL2 homolog n=1 Tax=Knipowitschia caucasica TaxID=637954 RepID=A0AAV2LFL9_KNICA
MFTSRRSILRVSFIQATILSSLGVSCCFWVDIDASSDAGMETLSSGSELRVSVGQCFRTLSSSSEQHDVICALQTLHSLLGSQDGSTSTSTSCSSAHQEEFRRCHYTRTLQFLISHIQSDWLHNLTATKNTQLWDSLFLQGPPEQALLVLLEGIGQISTHLDYLLSITETFLQTGRLNELLWSYCLGAGPADSPQFREALLGRVVALPDLMANKLQLNNRTVFLPQNYYPLLARGILIALERTCKALKGGSDCSLTFVAQTLGKVCIQGHSASVMAVLIPSLSERTTDDMVWQRVCWKLLENVPQRWIHSVLPPLVQAVSRPEALSRIMGNLVVSNKKAQFVMTHKMLLLQYKYETQVLRVLLGYLAADRERRPLLLQVLRSVCQAWANPSAVRHTPLQQQMYISKALLLSVALLREAELTELRSELLQCLLGGVQSHLDSSLVRVRHMGMAVGEGLSARLDFNGTKLKFEYEADEETQELRSLMNPTEEEEQESEPRRLDLSDVCKENPSSTAPQHQPQTADPDLDLDSDDELTPYDMSCDQKLNQASPPRYLRDCLEVLTSSEDAARMELGLNVAESLVLKNPFATKEISVQMTKVLLHIENKFNIDNFLSLRRATMVALVVTDCIPVTQYLSTEFYSMNYSLRQRLDILEVLAGAAQELSKPVCNKSETGIVVAASSHSSPNPGDDPEHWRQVVDKRIQSKTRRLNKGSTRPLQAAPNRYAAVAGHFFFPLLRNYDKPQVTFDLLGSDHLVLSRLIHTLGLFMHLALHAPAAAQMGCALLDFVWTVRYHAEQTVRRGVLFAVCSVFLSMPSQNLLLDLGDKVFETRAWLADVTEGDADSDCRSLALQRATRKDALLKTNTTTQRHATGDMAVYFDHPIDAPESSGAPIQLTWHSASPVLAVASSGPSSGAVDVYMQKGDFVERCHIERPYQPTVVLWHPTKPVLAVGWENGEVMLLTYPSGEHTALPSTHSVSCSLLQWSGFGSRLVTGDQNGVLAVWNIDGKGRLQGHHLTKHEYKRPLSSCVFKPVSPGDDVVKLAQASVRGDASALDKFGWNNTPLKIGPQEELTFYISTTYGTVYVVDENGKSSELLSVEGAIKHLYYFDKRDVLAVITETMVLSQYSLGPPGQAQEFMQVKLSSKSRLINSIAWTDNGILITTSGDQVVRLWDLDRDDNYVLSLEEAVGFESDEVVNCVAYCSGKGILAAGTSCGRIAMWKMVVQSGSNKTDNKIKWKLQAPSDIQGNVTQLEWSSNLHLLAANNSHTVMILSEHVMSAHFSQQVAAVQLSPTQLSVSEFNSDQQLVLQSDSHIKGVCGTKESLIVWSGKQITVYEITGSTLRISASFPCDTPIVAAHGENLYTVEPNKVQIRTPQGTVKQLLSFSKTEGNPVLLSVCQSYLVVGTDTAHIRVFDLSRRDAKAHSSAKNLADGISNLGTLISVKCNANASQVSVLITRINGKPDHKVYFYDVEMDTITHFDFFSGRPSSGITASEEGERQRFEGTELSGRCPVSHVWDESEPRLCVCEIVPISSESSASDPMDAVDVTVVTLFCTQEHGLLLHDCFLKPSGLQSLLALDVPYYYFICKPGEGDPSCQSKAASSPLSEPPQSPAAPKTVARRALRDFVGLETCDKITRDAMLNFSFYLTIGDMDEAFKSIKLIKSIVPSSLKSTPTGFRMD